MATAQETIANAKAGQGCLGKAANDEPVFVLRGQDKLAPGLIRNWAGRASGRGCPPAKWAGAIKVAEAMEEWQRIHGGKYPD